VLGSLILFRGGGVGPHLSWGVIAGAVVTTTAFFLGIVAAGVRAQRRRVTTGVAGLLGARGVAVERLAPDGRVRLGGTYWSAVSSAPLDAGSEVEVTGVDGLVLRVRPFAKEALS
jgi:membrane-bound serine protease (ClpP class)